MPQQIDFDGELHEFPDDFSQDDIAKALSSMPKPNTQEVQSSGQYSQTNPAPGAVVSVPQGDTPWYEMGDEYKAIQAATVAPNNPSGQYFSEHIPLPTNSDALALTGQAVGRGAADLVGAPVDISTMVVNSVGGLMNMLPGVNIPPLRNMAGGSDSIADSFSSIAEDAGYPIQDPEKLTGSDERNYDITRFATGAGIGGTTAATRAAGLIPSTSRLGAAVEAPYIGGPIRQVVDDTIAGAGAGYGSSVAEDAAPDSVLAQIAGTMLGGGAASTGSRMAESVATSPITAPYDRMNVTLPDGSKERRRTVRDAAKVFQNVASDPYQASKNIKEKNAMADDSGITRLTTGLAADDVGLGVVEKANRTSNPIPYIERDQRINTDVSNSISNLRDPNADVTAPQAAARQESDRLMGEAKGAAGIAKDRLRTAEQQQIDLKRETEDLVTPVLTQRGGKAEASKALDEQVGGALDERTKIKNEAFDKAAGDDTADISPIAESIKKVEDEVNKLGFENSGISKGFINRVSSMMPKMKTEEFGVDLITGGKMTQEVNVGGSGQAKLKDISKTRAEINSAIVKARTAGNFDLADNLSTLKKDINKMVDETASFDEAQRYYREEYAPFFAEGYGKEYRDTVQKASERTGKADAGNIADIFLRGTPDAAADLKKIVEIAPDSVKAQNAVERYMAADLASKIGADASPRAIANWIKDRSSQLDQFPEIKSKFEDLQMKAGSQEAKGDALRMQVKDLAEQFKKADGNIKVTEQRINKGILGTLIGQDPDKYVSTIMGGKNRLQKIDEVNKLIKGNKPAENGFKRAVTEHLLKTITGTNVKNVDDAEGPIQYAQIAKVMKENEDALAKVYAPSEMNALRRAQKLLSSYGNITRKGSKAGSDTVENLRNQSLMTAMEAGLKAKYGVLKGGGIMRTINITAKLLPGGRADKAEKLVARAMLDPDVAVHLLDAPNGDIGRPAWNKKLTMLLAGAAGGREAGEPNEGEQVEE